MARIFKRNKRWWLDYTDHRGKRVRIAASSDKSVAQTMLGKAIRNVEKLKAGVLQAEKTRRALSVEECKALLATAPAKRRLVYLFLIYTGLRRAEARSLTWAHLHLSGVNPHVELPASFTKSGRPERVPLVPLLAEELQAARNGDAAPSDRVFYAIPEMPTFRRDLKRAGIEETDARGRSVVLHSLRHSLATMVG